MKWFILSLFLVIAHTLSAQKDFMFRHLTVHDGLTDNEVKCILKDNNGFLWCATNKGINRYDGYNVKQYHNTSNNLSLELAIERMLIDADGNIWIDRYGHYFIYDQTKDQFIDAQPLLNKYQLNHNSEKQNIIIDDNKNIWSYNGKDIKFHDFEKQKTQTITQIPNDIRFFFPKGQTLFYIDSKNTLHIQDIHSPKSNTSINLSQTFNKGKHLEYKLYVDNSYDIWIYCTNAEGLWLLSKNQYNQWIPTTIGHTSYLTNNKVISICEDNNHKIWIGLEYDGISIYDKKNKSHTHISETESDYSLGSNKVWCFFNDDENTMWVGTMRNGISYYNKDFFAFKKTSMPFIHDIGCHIEDDENNLWTGTDGGGIFKQSPDGTLIAFNKENNKSFSNKIVCFYKDSKNKIWVGTYLEGFGYLENNRFQQYPFSSQFKKEPINNSIWGITEDNCGNIWLGNLKCGLHVLNTQTGHFETYNKTNSNLSDEHVMGLVFDGNKSIYMATCKGLNVIDTETRIINTITSNKKKTQFITDSVQNNIYIDSRKLIWIGGREGITILDMKCDSIYYLNKQDRLKGSLVRGITEDKNQNMWVVTTEGITNVKVSVLNQNGHFSFSCHPYSKDDGLQTSDFVQNSIYTLKNGTIIIGGNGGYYSINPSYTYTSKPSRVVFTTLKVFNDVITPDSVYNNNIILTNNIETTQQFTLKNNQNSFKLEFSTMEYVKTHNIRFSYRLKEINNVWTSLNSNQVSFNNMVPGTYTLEVRATNSDGIWQIPTAIQFTIQPPLWMNNWAIAFYGLSLLLIITYILYRNDRKHKRRLMYKEKEIEAQKQHEIDEMKLNFFTNLSHDFRTPLSLIIAPLEEVLKTNISKEVNNTLNIVYKNSLSLLNLVNQILDFRKIEIQEIKLQLENGDYILFIGDIIRNFSVYMEKNHLCLTFDKQIDNLYIAFDKDKIHKIIMNLLSNAIKYGGTPGKISVKIWTEDNKVYTSVADNGPGIQGQDKQKIFDPFYQIPNKNSVYGSGIGLHIVKQLVSIQHGEIFVENNIPQGSKFIFFIPLIKPVVETNCTNNLPIVDDEENQAINPEEKNSILIVEDYQDLREFLAESLKKEYKIYTAVDGLHALSIIQKETIDMIITDVMMPNMDGIELCKKIKSNIKVSHIPIIMLTAKNDIEYITKGFTEGADDYIQKPFNLDVLKLRINRIFKWKRECYKKFALEDIPTSDITSSSLDETFINKAIKIVEENMDNSQFSVEELSNSIGMSRSNLYNKTVSITGKTPSEFIRILRLKKSIKYLEQTQMTIAEVAFKVGFNSPKIFAHYFKEEYKMTPTDYRKQGISNTADSNQ